MSGLEARVEAGGEEPSPGQSDRSDRDGQVLSAHGGEISGTAEHGR